MPGSMNRGAIIGVWFGVLGVVAGAGALSGGSLTFGTGALWLFACVAPPAVMLMVWRRVPPPTVAQVPYTVDRHN